MTVARGLAAAIVIFAGVAVGSASPAIAADPIAGIYSYTQQGEPPAEWEIMPTCVPAGCMLHIASTYPGYGTQSEYPGFNGDAKPVNGVWTVGVNKYDGLKCPDGSREPVSELYKFDEHALTGTRTRFHGAVCGLSPGAEPPQPFNLAYVSPLRMPVELYPLMCPTWPHCEADTVIPGTLNSPAPPPE